MNSRTPHAGISWKIALGLLVAFFVGAQIVTMIFAGKKVGKVVDPDYYKNGKNYGKNLHAAQAARPDWVMSTSLQADRLQIALRDRAGAVISGAHASLQMDGAPPLQLPEASPGIYRSSPIPTAPELRGTLSITKGEAIFTDKLVLFR